MDIIDIIHEKQELDRLLFQEGRSKTMYTFNVYLEPADTDDKLRWIGTITADTAAEALEQAAQFYEYDSADLVVERRYGHEHSPDRP